MSLRRSLIVTLSSKYLELGLQFLASVLLARLLTPEDFGIYSIAASIALIGYMLRNFGVGQYIIQADKLDDDLLRSAFSVTLAISWVIALLLLLVAAPAGTLYGNPGVATVLRFLAVNFVILPFGSIADAVLRRNMEFDKIGVIVVSSALAATLVGVGSAWLGAGYLAIVWATNADTLTTILLTLYFRPIGLPWRPGLRSLRKVAGFGIKVGVSDMLSKGGDAASEMIIGKAQGLTLLGMYSRAYGAFLLFEYAFIEGVRPVVLPFLSEAKRDNAMVAPLYVQIVSYVSIFMGPFFVFLLFNTSDTIRVLYGDQWHAAVPVLQVLCIGGLLMIPTVFFEQLLIAHSRPGLAVKYQLVFQGTRLLALALLVQGSLTEAAIALVFGVLIKALATLYLAHQQFEVRPLTLARRLLPAGFASLAIGGLMWVVTDVTANLQLALLRLAISGLLFALAWLVLVFVLKHPISDEIRNLVRLRADA